MTNKVLLQWQRDMGADEFIQDAPRNYFAAPIIAVEPLPETAPAAQQTIRPSPSPISAIQASPSLAASSARELADKATSLAELRDAITAFDGCGLKKTASKMVFADGNPENCVMIIGEAPGAQEDLQGIPFCGPSGMLLDKMFAAIGLNREQGIYISNTVFWRPPGNRQPSMEETSICLPFVEKHIALVKPRLLLLAGGTAVHSLLRKEESMSRLRGRAYDYANGYIQTPIPTLVTYHPSYLLRQPAAKRLAWADMLMLKAKLA